MAASFVLKCNKDRFGGRVCELRQEKGRIMDQGAIESFNSYLSGKVEEWKAEGARGIWIKVSDSLSAVIPCLLDNGFRYHHAQAKYAMLIRWLPEDPKDPDVLPEYCTQSLGVGGLCMRMSPPGTFQERELLAIVEEFSFDEFDRWKLPGGAVDPGERISDAVEREVLEETGLKATFRSVVCMQHTPKFRFGRGDVYMVCRLEPSSDYSKHVLCPQSGEIAKAKWIPVSRFLNDPHVLATNRRFVAMAVLHENRGVPHMIMAGTSCTVPSPDDPEHPDAPPPMTLRDAGKTRPLLENTGGSIQGWRTGPSAKIGTASAPAASGTIPGTSDGMEAGEASSQGGKPASSGAALAAPSILRQPSGPSGIAEVVMREPSDGGDQGVPQTPTPKPGSEEADAAAGGGGGAAGSSTKTQKPKSVWQYKTDVLYPWPRWSRAAAESADPAVAAAASVASAFGSLAADEAEGWPREWRDGRSHWYPSAADGQRLLEGVPDGGMRESRLVAQGRIVYGTEADGELCGKRREDSGVQPVGGSLQFIAGAACGAAAAAVILLGARYFATRTGGEKAVGR